MPADRPFPDALANVAAAISDALTRVLPAGTDWRTRLTPVIEATIDRLDLVPAFANWLTRAGRALLDEADLIVPVPLHRTRLWQRRYNVRRTDLAKTHFACDPRHQLLVAAVPIRVY